MKMSTFEELKKVWEANQESAEGYTPYDHKSLDSIIKSRTKKNMKKAMHYFWGVLFFADPRIRTIKSRSHQIWRR